MVADIGNIDSSELDALLGYPVTGWPTNAWLKPSDAYHDGEPDDVLQSYLGIPIFSARFKDALSSAGIQGDIQYLPVSVCHSSGKRLDDFWIVNVTRRVEALDLTLSVYRRRGPEWAEIDPERVGTIGGILKPVLIAQRLAGYDVIRLAEFSPELFVSERFKRVFEENRFTGYGFRRVKTV